MSAILASTDRLPDVAHGTRVVEPAGWRDAVLAARDDGFTFFDWLSAADRTDETSNPGFDVVVHLLDPATPGELSGILVRTRVADGEPLESVTTVFAGAAWHERETHEMFGIPFSGFDDGTGLGLRPL
ncbi:MAG: NADH-quinone oxidoreductase subunit C, partial [Phycicoccus sp.]